MIMLFGQLVHAQDMVLTTIPPTGKDTADFIPAGYEILKAFSGDLNKDSIADLVLVLKDKRENIDTTYIDYTDIDRILIILFKTPDGYKLMAKTNKLILCKSCGGFSYDPFDEGGITIENRVLTIYHHGGGVHKWDMERKFRYQNGDFYLIGMSEGRYNNTNICDNGDFAETDHNEINYLTGVRAIKKISGDCKVIADKTFKIKRKPLTRLIDCNLKDYQF